MKSGKGAEIKSGPLYETALLMYEPKGKEGIKHAIQRLIVDRAKNKENIESEKSGRSNAE